MSALRCSQKLRTAMALKPRRSSEAHDPDDAGNATEAAAPSLPPAILGDWSMTLVFTRMRPAKLVLAVSEHDRIGLLIEALPFATLPQRFNLALHDHLLLLGIPPAAAQQECAAMQPLRITASTGHANRRSIQQDLTDYTLRIHELLMQGEPTLARLNLDLSRQSTAAAGVQQLKAEPVHSS